MGGLGHVLQQTLLDLDDQRQTAHHGAPVGVGAVAVHAHIDETLHGQPDFAALMQLVRLQAPVFAAKANAPDVNGHDVPDLLAAPGQYNLGGRGAVGEQRRVEHVEQAVHAAVAAVDARVQCIEQAARAGGRDLRTGLADFDVVARLAQALPGPDRVGNVRHGVAQVAADLEQFEGHAVGHGHERAKAGVQVRHVVRARDRGKGASGRPGRGTYSALSAGQPSRKSVEPIRHAQKTPCM